LIFGLVTEQTVIMPNSPLDDVSKAIIEQLQKDGRMPFAAIGKIVGLSEAAVRQRVAKLLESDVVQIAAITNPLRVGRQRMAMIGIHVEGDVEKIADEIAALGDVSYVVVTAGSFDLLAEVVCEDDDQLLDIVNRHIRKLDGVRGTETFMYLNLKKQTFNWGIH
jgi:Lrp/AsnC family transcriptional regulator for asnA, asnC and gidA